MDIKNITKINLFNNFTESLSVQKKELSIRLLHLNFTHYPVDFDGECVYRGDNKQWRDKNQNVKGVYNESKCVLIKAEAFLKKLKKLNIYNKSLIIIKSDHGEPAGIFNEYPNNMAINNHDWWGYNRYRPMMLFKDFNTTNSEIIYRKELVLLNDIANTICRAAEINLECDYFPGEDLRQEDIKTNNPYYIYIPRDETSTHELYSQISVRINTRNIPLLDVMTNNPVINLSKHINK